MPRQKLTPSDPEILDYKHKGVKRKNNPEEGLTTYLPEESTVRKFQYDPHLDPQLVWAGKIEHASFEVPVLPLHIHERVTPLSIASRLQRKVWHQLRLFDEGEYPLEKRIDFYKHDIDWANRLILGDSLIVMNSLLTKELMGGKVQMIYMDPPYGIAYSSNFQPTLSSREVKGGEDNSLTRETEQIKAYRDTWEWGVHSYLTYLRDRLLLCRELLGESGSIFVQISDRNLHLVRAIMDEVFDPKNFCAIIAFAKTSAFTSELLSSSYDFLLWYAKDKERVKYNPLWRPRLERTEGGTYNWIELENGECRRLTASEIRGETKLPKGRRFRADTVVSPGAASSGPRPVILKGKEYWPSPNSHWKTTSEGMDKLIEVNRIIPVGKVLAYKRYEDDFPYMPYSNVWDDTIIGTYSEKFFVVQTSTAVVKRCMLMTADTGDLVFDPTCGSGTTAYVAEQLGRRWITCDTSRVALAIARQRILAAVYPYYILAHPAEGIKSGFIYETLPHITLKSIAQNEQPLLEVFYDKPKINNSVVRVSGPFTVEGIPAPSVTSGEEQERQSQNLGTAASDYISALIEAIKKSGVIFPEGKKITFDNLNAISSAGFVHAEGASAEVTGKVAVSFGPRYGPIGAVQTEGAIRTATANGYSMLILAGFSFDPGALSFVEKTPLKLQVQFAHINPDMEIHDLLKETRESQLFTVFGEPDAEIIYNSDGKIIVKLRGVDIYDPTTGSVEQTGAENLPAWFLDEDYDGYSFNICQVFFPDGATNEDPWDKLERALHGFIDKEKIEQFRGTISLPFIMGQHASVAVKVLDARGNEVIRVIKLKEVPK